jgi:hypothetical protein
MLKKIMRAPTALLLAVSACGGGDDDIQSRTERLRPAATRCSTSDDCLYGYCSTEDGECQGGGACPPGVGTCAAVCFGSCIAAAPPDSTP